MLLVGIAMFVSESDIHAESRTGQIPQFRLSETSSVWDALSGAIESECPLPLDSLGADAAVYRHRVRNDIPASSQWCIGDTGGLALVFIDGNPTAVIDGKAGKHTFSLPAMEAGTTVEIFVARGSSLTGEIGKVEMTGSAGDAVELSGWRNFPVPDDYSFAASLTYSTDAPVEGPTYYRGNFNVTTPADTYLDLSTWGQGTVYVNGYRVGAFSKKEPTLSLSASSQRAGDNEIIVFDVIGPERPDVRGVVSPGAVGRLRAGLPCELTPDMIVAEGELTADGWKEVEFAFPVNTRYIAFEIDGADGVTSLAEVRIVGPGINRVSQERWKVAHASSETPEDGYAENIFDMDESTRWKPAKEESMPQTVVIDMGSSFGVTGVQMLMPDSETGQKKRCRYRIYAL